MSQAKAIITLVLCLCFGIPLVILLAAFVWYVLPFVPIIAQVLAVVVLLVLAGGLYQGWHWVNDKREMRNLHRRHETVKLELMQEQHALIQSATLRGYNVKITAETTEIINPISLMHSPRAVIESMAAPAQVAAPAQLLLPGPCDFSTSLTSWRPSMNEILLSYAPGGNPVFVPAKSLCHVALAGATGGGKSVLMRLLLSQLLYIGCKVLLADPHFAPYDVESDEDWRPIANRLYMQPAVSGEQILHLLTWLAQNELPARLQKRRDGQHPGEPLFLAMDELPAIVAHVPEAPELMAAILREGRKVGIFLISAAQDWLVKTVGGSGGVRDCFRTAFYVGGDATTARVLLDVKGTVDDGGLGKGIVMLRSQATPQAQKMRVPFVSNDALYDLLTPSQPTYNTPASTPDEISNIRAFPTARSGDAVVSGTLAMLTGRDTDPVQEIVLDARSLRIRELVRSGIAQSKIIEEVWGISAKAGGTSYIKASRELSEIMSKLV